ncbi:MAG: hypothetical protein AB1589_07615 [Cyanobacteriota bacterium]
MPQVQSTIATSQTNTTIPPIDPTPLLQSNSPTAIILSIAILLWVLRPVMMQQKSGSSESESDHSSLLQKASTILSRVLKSDTSK